MDDVLRVSGSCVIPISEIEWRFTPSGGPGGQHANRSNTRVEARFDVAGSPSLGPRQRARLIERLGDVVGVVADDERSQSRNRTLALERLRSKLAEGLRERRPRHPTAPTKSSEQRRIESKRRRSQLKRQRARPTSGDDT
ncbi:MAG: alternative ribosome rescue aminoacyl-tRNA hydrolase ArfB [Acidimicrobiales bacterium]